MSQAELLTDDEINKLLALPKIITKKERKKLRDWKESRGFRRIDISLKADSSENFSIFGRATIDDPLDFSIGLKAVFSDGSNANLIRCNGQHGGHKNVLEHERFEGRCHVHQTTERYIQGGWEAEKFAAITDTYITSDGALEYLMKRCNIDFEDIEIR
ncbi:MAG: hypothetical protein LBO82_05085 [Synergistaceae bacterium]|nr:hypothetical protein [Synergistaceae bacterium]